MTIKGKKKHEREAAKRGNIERRWRKEIDRDAQGKQRQKRQRRGLEIVR